MTKPTAAANATGLPESHIGPYGPMSCSIDMPALRKMRMAELKNLRSALRTLSEVAIGLCCQPRFSDEEDSDLNDAGRTLDYITEFLSAYEQAVVNVAEAAKPVASDDVEDRAWTLLGFQADLTDELSSFAVWAAQAVRDEVEAKFREQHAVS
ncbi:hypothetical protein FQV39_03415 [Bosea sp. F3-2]|uniref:hypothetical protein n=1 Tax=Bosea sp. F3-2 TaxID=2599640 RepID=UPI0011EC4BD5|nr:hypothetical protein [Bosea sp. F3-2]QEL21731.1 hypothetical protein FQV39_03415 [Bosea sp. F3-2]